MGFPISSDIFGQLKWLVKQVKLLQFKIASAEQFITLTSAYPAASGTGLQKLFNTPTNGTFTLSSNTSYFFEGFVSLSAMAASGTIAFGFSGTFTPATILYIATAQKVVITGPNTPTITIGTSAASLVVTPTGSATTGYIFVKGKLTVGAEGGTIVPSFALSVSATAPVVAAGSYFRFTPIGSNTVTSIGNWS